MKITGQMNGEGVTLDWSEGVVATPSAGLMTALENLREQGVKLTIPGVWWGAFNTAQAHSVIAGCEVVLDAGTMVVTDGPAPLKLPQGAIA